MNRSISFVFLLDKDTKFLFFEDGSVILLGWLIMMVDIANFYYHSFEQSFKIGTFVKFLRLLSA